MQGKAGYDPAVDGKHIIALLSYMNRNGLDFARPNPGREFAYHNMFRMMMTLYLTVADVDESLQPIDLSKEADQ